MVQAALEKGRISPSEQLLYLILWTTLRKTSKSYQIYDEMVQNCWHVLIRIYETIQLFI